MLSKFLSLILITFCLTMADHGWAKTDWNDQYNPNKPYLVLIPGAGSNGGEIYIKNFSKLLKITGHGEYFGRYTEYFKDMGLALHLCPKTKDLDRTLLAARSAECVASLISSVRMGLSKVPQRPGVKPRRNIILLGHSMGGNIARMVANDPQLGPYVHSVITVATPNKGTPIADFVFDQYSKGWESEFYKTIMESIGFTPDEKRYLSELTVEQGAGSPGQYYAQNVRQVPFVHYFSMTNSMEHTIMPPLEVTNYFIKNEMKKRGLDQTEYGSANDGIVPEYSMVLGQVIGSVKADHWATLCIGILKFTNGCMETKKVLLPFVQNLSSEIDSSLTERKGSYLSLGQ